MENKRVYYFKHLQTFLNNKDSLPKESFSLIEETGQFYVNGQFFSENTLFNLNQLLENVSGELSKKDTTNEAVIKLYKLIQDTNNLIKLLVSEIYDLRKTTNECIDETNEIVASGLSQHWDEIQHLLKDLDDLQSTLAYHENETYGTLHIPQGGHSGQILTQNKDGVAQWQDISKVLSGLEETLAYGVEWDTEVADPHLTRIGNMSLHKTLPIQSQLKGCIAQNDKVIYQLNESDWRFKKNPETVSIGLTVDGGYSLVSDIFSTLRYENQWVKIGGVACQIDSINTDTNTATLVANDQLDALGLVTGTQDVEFGAVLNGYDGTVRVYCPTSILSL